MNVEHWYVLKVVKGKELEANESIARVGFRSYVPMRRVDKRKSRDMKYSKKPEITPAFDGYLFVCLREGEDDFSLVKSLRNALDFIKSPREDGNKYPTAVHTSVIEALQIRENDEGLHPAKSDYSKGERIRFISGPFKGYVATVTGTSEERINSLLSMFDGREIKIPAEYHHVEPA